MARQTEQDKKVLAFWDIKEQRALAKECGVGVQDVRDAAYAVSNTEKPSRSPKKIKKYLEELKAKQEEALQGDIDEFPNGEVW